MKKCKKWTVIVAVFCCMGVVLFFYLIQRQGKIGDTAEAHQPQLLLEWQQVIEDYYHKVFRNCIIHDDIEFRPYQGQTVIYRAYDLENGYIRTEVELKDTHIEKEKLGDFTYLFLAKDGKFELCEEDCKTGGSTKKEALLEGTLMIETNENITFEDFEGKGEILKNLENALCYRYFSTVKREPFLKPIFWETTRAVRVWIMDFGVLESEAIPFMVFTEDGYVFGEGVAVSLSDGSFSIYEIPESEIWLSDAESGAMTAERYEHFFRWFKKDGTVNHDTIEAHKIRVEDFSHYYHFFKNHIICCIELDEEYY